jgi:hypothetical protein
MEDCEAELIAIEQRHMQELPDKREDIESRLPLIYKPSSNLLKMRHMVPRLIQLK